jgi:hypothetical protein
MSLTSGTRFIGISENVNLKERKSAIINAETQPFTAQDIANFIGPGATGPQGVQGPAGPLGPVGPAGLTWRGAWVSGTSYIANDAVGYNGASYFCILATSGTSNPTVATTNWALLASQGAQGIQGVQGPTGPQGAGATQTLQQTVTLGNTVTGGTNKTTLSGNSALVSNIATPTTAVEISSNAIYLNKGGTSTSIVLPSTVTGDHVYTLPNASGNLALQSYKVWRAKIDTSSVITVLSDEIGFTSPVITNPSNGKILITKTGFFTGINAAKIDLITSTVNNSGTPFVCTLERYNIALNNSIILNVFDMAGTQTGTPSTTFTVEIRIYN